MQYNPPFSSQKPDSRSVRSGYARLMLLVSLFCCTATVGISPVNALAPQANTYYGQSRQAELSGNLASAESLLRQAIALDAQDYLNYVKLASLLGREGKPNEAASLYRQALALNPHDAMIHYSLGGLYEQMGQYESAEKAYLEALRSNPRYQFGLLNLARVDVQLKRYEPAIANYRQFLMSYPNHYEARRRLASLYRVNHQEALAVQEYTYLEQHFPEQFTDYLNFSRALRATGQPRQAITRLEVAIDKTGKNAELMEEFGHAEAALNHGQEAIRQYQAAYQLNPKKDELLLAIGDLYQKDQKALTAAEYYNTFLVSHPDHVPARQMLAESYLEGQKYDLAKQEIDRLLSTLTDPEARYQKEKDKAYASQMLGEQPEAIQQYEQLSKSPFAQSDLQLRMNLAIAYHQASQLENAVVLYQQIFMASPELQQQYHVNTAVLRTDLLGALLKLGDLAYGQKSYAVAESRYLEAAPLSQDMEVAADLGLGNTYFSTGNLEKATQAYQRVLQRDPGNVTAKLNLAKVLLAQKKTPAPTTGNAATGESKNSTANHPLTPLVNGVVANPNAFNGQSSAEQLEPVKPPATITKATQPKDLAPFLETLAKENPDNFDVLITLADVYTQQGKYQQSIDVYQKALKIYPDNVDILLLIGAQWKAMGNLPQARDTYQKAASLDVNRSDVHFNLGIVYNGLHQYPESIAAYEKSLQLDPANAEARYGLAISLDDSKRYPQAAEQYMLYSVADNAEHSTEAKQRVEALKSFLLHQQKKK
jgi:tetratricopeptide (TPR) repeat protein